MWIQKLSSSVLRVVTPLGPRYMKPSSKERLYLAWMFRHFPTLPEHVLSPRQQKLISRLEREFQFVPDDKSVSDLPLIGTVERRPKFHS
ncbi:MAG TPA: hypothetical protein VKY85_23850 [Candidatus Angelobacter sp.]|jgi:hypothetical protein|nr:hypothetical protein [Candidatus Angelobacter sp.]